MNNPTVKFCTFEDFNARVSIGSSKIRAKWLCNQWPEASIHKFGDDADVFIYQKVYWVEHAKECKRIKILDLCDADWLSWGYRIKEMIDNCDGVTCNTDKTSRFISQITDKPVVTVPDRIDYDSLPEKRAKHEGNAKTAVWYGYANNFTMLNSALDSLVKLGFEKLLVVADKPYGLPERFRDKLDLTNYPYTEETAYKDIQRADVCLNPQFGTGKWQFKSISIIGIYFFLISFLNFFAIFEFIQKYL